MPLIIAVGRNTTTRLMVVAMTASAISLTASSVASRIGLPMWRCRSIFSISTMASSTRMPTTTASASSVTVLSEKPRKAIAAKVGRIDSGRAADAISVARQSRRNSHTTIMARMAPS